MVVKKLYNRGKDALHHISKGTEKIPETTIQDNKGAGYTHL